MLLFLFCGTLSTGIYALVSPIPPSGPNVDAFLRLCEEGASVIVTVDCGQVGRQGERGVYGLLLECIVSIF